MSLGLTLSQARIYLSSVQHGRATAKVLSKTSNIGREDVYRVLPSLYERGLIKKYLCSPTVYEAIPPKEAVAMLLKHKEEEYLATKAKAGTFVKHFQNCTKVSPPTNDDETTVWVVNDEKSPITPQLMDAVNQTKKMLFFTTRFNLFVYSMNNQLQKHWIKALLTAAKRGVQIRMILDKPVESAQVEDLFFKIEDSNSLIRSDNFRFRYSASALECILILFDDKWSLIENSQKNDLSISPYIWTNNPVLLSLTNTYFNAVWGTATEKCLNP